MLIMPILYKDKIYNVNIKLKDVYEEQDLGIFEKHYESDIVVNGQSYNKSSYNVINAPLNNTIDFIRNNALYSSNSFLLTSKRNENGKMKTYRIAQPPIRVTEGLDALYSSAILSMKKETPGKREGRSISLKKLGVTDHITTEKLRLVTKTKEISYEDLKTVNRIGKNTLDEFYQTIQFLSLFDCTILEDATVELKALDGIIQPFSVIGLKEDKKLRNYYKMAEENAEEYAKLESMARNITGQSIGWIKEEPKIVKIKNLDGKNDYKKVA